nr:immunoglobulin light chain junction region [Macaca mulatta]MOX23515.1 immunoglobulin light chain junction region [Macaca mulatta]MOX24143.1 immunoglobulin light chain junction region [Macaca mulatta]MOX24516.1 immunoglobulin light chain junction region [Macaca mulatta]MOX24606.1 immunoglobulin light chain junction region [Macaca mulatta]
CQQGDNAPFTF